MFIVMIGSSWRSISVSFCVKSVSVLPANDLNGKTFVASATKVFFYGYLPK